MWDKEKESKILARNLLLNYREGRGMRRPLPLVAHCEPISPREYIIHYEWPEDVKDGWVEETLEAGKLTHTSLDISSIRLQITTRRDFDLSELQDVKITYKPDPKADEEEVIWNAINPSEEYGELQYPFDYVDFPSRERILEIAGIQMGNAIQEKIETPFQIYLKIKQERAKNIRAHDLSVTRTQLHFLEHSTAIKDLIPEKFQTNPGGDWPEGENIVDALSKSNFHGLEILTTNLDFRNIDEGKISWLYWYADEWLRELKLTEREKEIIKNFRDAMVDIRIERGII